MKIIVDTHYSLKEIYSSLQEHFKNYIFLFSPSGIEVRIPHEIPLILIVKGKEIILRRRSDFANLIPFLSSFIERNDLSNNVHAKEILIFIKNDLCLIQDDNYSLHELSSICPNCKSPNNNKLKICEWCGGKML